MSATSRHQALPSRLRLREVKRKRSDQVHTELMERIALAHANEMWGPDVGQGSPLPILDDDGAPVLYAFPFAIGRREFPDPHTLIKRYSKLRQPPIWSSGGGLGKRASPACHPFPPSVRHELAQFGTVYVSATRQDFPVPRVLHGLHPYFYNAELALARAKAEVERSRPRLTHIRLTPPFYEYFEIRAARTTRRFHAHTLMSEREMQAAASSYKRDIHLPESDPQAAREHAKSIRRGWEYYGDIHHEPPEFVSHPSPLPTPETIHRIPHYELVPPLVQGYWCEATAVAMVFAYWDHYVPGTGSWIGYGRIVDYWLDHPANGANMPNLIDEVIDCSTYEEFANDLNDYNWSFDTVYGNPQNDWGWDALVSELNAGRPARWKCFGPIDHANCAFGYRIANNGGKYVLLYNTWWTSPDEWLYNARAGTPLSHTEVNRYVPGGAESNRALYIRHPYGGETYNAGQKGRIRFKAGSDVKVARIEYSADGGDSWDFVVELAVSPGWNRFNWKFPSVPTTRARIRIQGMSVNREFLAGDGSFMNFTVE